MFRWFVILLLAAGIAGGVAYFNGWLSDYVVGGQPPLENQAGHQTAPVIEVGDLLYPAEQRPPLPESRPRPYSELVIDLCNAVVHEKQEVSSPREGHLLFTGELVKKDVEPNREVRTVKLFDGRQEISHQYYPLKEGHTVVEGQPVAAVDFEMAYREMKTREAKLAAIEAQLTATTDILAETVVRLEDLRRLERSTAQLGVVTRAEMSDARAAYYRYKGDKVAKTEEVKVAQSEYFQAQLLLSQHILKSQLPGTSVVRKIYKNSGEGIKAQEPVMQLWNLSRLRVEGSVDSQYYQTLLANKGTLCYLEPSVEMAPELGVRNAHRREVTSVAVCADGKHFVSGSADQTVCVWHRDFENPVWTLPHAAAVRSVACTPKGQFLLAGCGDGSITFWDLSVSPPKSLWSKSQHQGPVTALAFSPDGAFFATGGEDQNIKIWKTEGGELLYAMDRDRGVEDPHRGAITTLHMTKQCTLVSAARDNTLRVWTLHQKGPKQLVAPIANRGGGVGQLGVSADGRFMLFDKGRTLQLRSTADGSTVCALNNLAGASPFDTLALFSPDGSAMLTGGAGEGRLQLWKTPTPQDRAFQVRELVTVDRAAITSAAFAPAGHRFAVSGSKDGFVHVWQLPDEGAVKTHAVHKDAKNTNLRLDFINQEIDANKTRIAVNVHNPVDARGQFLLTPGQRVTLVIVLSRGKDL